MTDDIVARLRLGYALDYDQNELFKFCNDAANEIERLQQWVNELELLAMGLDDASIKCCKLEEETEQLREALNKAHHQLDYWQKMASPTLKFTLKM